MEMTVSRTGRERGSIAVSLGLRKPGSGGSGRGQGRKSTLSRQLTVSDMVAIGSRYDSLRGQEEVGRAKAATEEWGKRFGLSEDHSALNRLPLELRSFVISPETLDGHRTATAPGSAPAGQHRRIYANQNRTAIERPADNEELDDALQAFQNIGLNLSQYRRKRIRPGRLPIRSSAVTKRIREQILSEAASDAGVNGRPPIIGLTARMVADIVRDFHAFQINLTLSQRYEMDI